MLQKDLMDNELVTQAKQSKTTCLLETFKRMVYPLA